MNTFAFDASLHNNKKVKRSKQLLDGCSEFKNETTKRDGVFCCRHWSIAYLQTLGLMLLKLRAEYFVMLRCGISASNCDNQFEHFQVYT